MGRSSSSFSVCLLFWSVIHLAVAHICLITPRQRGDMDISQAGSHTCSRHEAPCGGQPPQFPPKVNLEAGRPVFIKWQQNLNHYSVGYPGYMDIAIAVANEVANLDHVTDPSDPFQVLAVVADKDEYDQANQRNYTAVVTLPNMACDHCVIRARYVAHKPGETTFYQCTDVTITTNQTTHQESSRFPNLFMPGPVLLPRESKNELGYDTTEPSLMSVLSRDNNEIGLNLNNRSDLTNVKTERSFHSDSNNFQIKKDASAQGEKNLQKAIEFTDKHSKSDEDVRLYLYGMTNDIEFPGNGHLVTFDTVTGIRYDVAPLSFRVDSPIFGRDGLARTRLNSSLDYVTDGVVTLDTARGVAVMPMNRHHNMDATADTVIEMSSTGGDVKSVYNVISGNNKTLPMRSAFSAVIVEIESSYVTFNIEPDEKEEGKFNFIVGRLYAGGSWVMLSKTDQPEDLYINFQWAEYDISVKTLYVLLGNENDPLGLSARLYKFFVMPGGPPAQPSSDSPNYVTLDVSKYPFMAFHLHPYHANLLYAISPGLHNQTSPSYHLVVVDVDLGTVKEEMQITPPGIFERFYGGVITNGLRFFRPQILHVLRVAGTQADVILNLHLDKKQASFSQLTNLRNVYSLYAVYS